MDKYVPEKEKIDKYNSDYFSSSVNLADEISIVLASIFSAQGIYKVNVDSKTHYLLLSEIDK